MGSFFSGFSGGSDGRGLLPVPQKLTDEQYQRQHPIPLIGLENCKRALKRCFSTTTRLLPIRAVALVGRSRVGKRSVLREYCQLFGVRLHELNRPVEFEYFNLTHASRNHFQDGPHILSIHQDCLVNGKAGEHFLDMFYNPEAKANPNFFGIVFIATRPLTSFVPDVPEFGKKLTALLNGGVHYATAPIHALRVHFLECYAESLGIDSGLPANSEFIQRLASTFEGYTLGELFTFVNQLAPQSSEQIISEELAAFLGLHSNFTIVEENLALDRFFSKRVSRKRERDENQPSASPLLLLLTGEDEEETRRKRRRSENPPAPPPPSEAPPLPPPPSETEM